MTVLRTLALFATIAVTAAAAAQVAGCTNGTTPVCDDAGSCLILSNPSDAPVGPQGEGGETGGDGSGGGPHDAGGG